MRQIEEGELKRSYIMTYRFEDGFVVDILERGLTKDEYDAYIKIHGKCETQSLTSCTVREVSEGGA